MSHLVSRILLSILMFPLAAICYIFLCVVGMNVSRSTLPYPDREIIVFGLCGLITWMFVAAYWYLLWRSSVNWNTQRNSQTGLAVLGALFLASIVGGLGSAVMPRSSASFGVFIGGILAIVLWLIATVFIWRETAGERTLRLTGSPGSAVACPTCGYNLTGLSESRCPECGSRFTLEELMAAQPQNKIEIE